MLGASLNVGVKSVRGASLNVGVERVRGVSRTVCPETVEGVYMIFDIRRLDCGIYLCVVY